MCYGLTFPNLLTVLVLKHIQNIFRANIQDSLHYLLCKQNVSRNYFQLFSSFTLNNLKSALQCPKPSWIVMSLASSLISGFFLKMHHCSVRKTILPAEKLACQKTGGIWHGYQAGFSGAARL